VKHPFAALALTALAGIAAWQSASALQNEQAPAQQATPAAPQGTPPRSRTPGPAPRPALPAATAETPMADRVAVVGILNKRNGLGRDVTLKPGQGVRIGDLIVRLRACETTAPWEPQKLTGAFLQADVRGRDQRWRRIFSGWVYKESPSLNVVEHPIYDVWPKSCTMRHPDIGPDTVSVAAPAPASRRSSAKKSANRETPAEPSAPVATTPSAASSNPT
jgi:hypothetical protein